MKLIDKIPLIPLAILAVFLAVAPISPQPHLLEKLGMLSDGLLTKPLDIFDLVWHSFFLILLVIKIVRLRRQPAG